MISDEGQPILMDFGSTVKARIPITSRSIALEQQDQAAEQSTMAYRAPELFDVKTGSTLDEKVDIWASSTIFHSGFSQFIHIHRRFPVPWLFALCPCIFPFAL
jgi:serine/threonine kinase 16